MTTAAENEAIARQFAHPSGTKGIEIADMMYRTNLKMINHAIDKLDVQRNDRILELGHGNALHLPYLLAPDSSLRYYGFEISELMQQVAQDNNRIYTATGQASFHLYAGAAIPLADRSMEKAFTVNTIYFWKDPVRLLQELHRVLKPCARLSITYADRQFMETLPFTTRLFTLYNKEQMHNLIKQTAFDILDSENQVENIQMKSGTLVQREFTTLTLKK